MNTATKSSTHNRNVQKLRLAQAAAVWCLTVLLLALTGCHHPQPASTQSSAREPAASAAPTAHAAADTNGPVRIHEGDALKIEFAGETNMNAIVKVQIDGNLNLPLIGEVKAVNKTALELQDELKHRYEPLLKVNEVTVTIVSTSVGVYVSGAVLRPGRVPMDRPMTVLDAIMEAGGFDLKRAKLSAVKVLRMEHGKQVYFEVNVKRALNGQDPAPFYLTPFDIVHVPEKTFNF